MDGRPVKSFSKDQMARFVEHPVWQEIKASAEERLDLIRYELEVGEVPVADTTGTAHMMRLDYAEIRARQAECQSLRWILEITNLLTQKKETSSEQKE